MQIMTDIGAELDKLEVLREAELLVLANQYPVFDRANYAHILDMGKDPLFREYMQEVHDIELYYARAKHDLQRNHSAALAQDELMQYDLMHRKQRDWLHLPRFTLWDVVLGLLGR
jgi:hypothetical protein